MSNSLENDPFAIRFPVATATNAETDAALAAFVENPPKNLKDLAESVRQLAKSLHAAIADLRLANSHIASLLSRLAIVESSVAMLQYAPKPAWPTPVPLPYYPSPGPYIEPWQTPPWRPGIVWCGEQEQGKLSDGSQ